MLIKIILIIVIIYSIISYINSSDPPQKPVNRKDEKIQWQLIRKYEKRITDENIINYHGFILKHEEKSKLGEEILEDALSYVEGQKVLSNLYIPIGDNKYTEIDSVSIGTSGIQVWDAKMFHTHYIVGKKDKEKWGRANNIADYSYLRFQYLKDKENEEDERYKLFHSPYIQNRNHIRALRKTLRNEGVRNIKFFSGIALEKPLSKETDVEGSYDERCCYMFDTHIVSRLWANDTSAKPMTKTEVEGIYNILKKYTNVSNEVKESHVERLKEKYGEA